MKHLKMALMLVACPMPPEPLPPAEPGCSAYCERVAVCEPDGEYPACESDCIELMADPVAQRVSGIDAEHVACWSAANTCEEARACP